MSETLTPRQAEVARLYRAGWTVDGIAERLGVAEKSVRTYANQVRRAGVAIPRAPQRGGWQRRVSWGEVCRLAREGLRQAAIAERLGCSKQTVSKILCDMRAAGEPLPPGGRWPGRGA